MEKRPRANRGTGANVTRIPSRLRRRSDIQSHCRSFGAGVPLQH